MSYNAWCSYFGVVGCGATLNFKVLALCDVFFITLDSVLCEMMKDSSVLSGAVKCDAKSTLVQTNQSV